MTATRGLYVAVGLGLSALFAFGWAEAWAFERELFWLRASGWAGATLLLASIVTTPIGRLAGRFMAKPPSFGPLRRALGLSAAACASLHAGVALATYLGGAWGQLLALAWLRAGVLALLLLLALWLTSYPRVVRALRVKLWKPLHRLVFVAALLALQHALLSPMADRAWVLGVFGLGGLLALLRLVPQARRSTPSQASSQSHT